MSDGGAPAGSGDGHMRRWFVQSSSALALATSACLLWYLLHGGMQIISCTASGHHCFLHESLVVLVVATVVNAVRGLLRKDK